MKAVSMFVTPTNLYYDTTLHHEVRDGVCKRVQGRRATRMVVLADSGLIVPCTPDGRPDREFSTFVNSEDDWLNAPLPCDNPDHPQRANERTQAVVAQMAKDLERKGEAQS
jgi:hypothetical protein